MSKLLDYPLYGPRQESIFLEEMNHLTQHHLEGCDVYVKIFPQWQPTNKPEELPFLHVGTFKHIDFRTEGKDIHHERTLKSSATTSSVASRIPLDSYSSQLQSRSSETILKNFLGNDQRPLLILDSAHSLRTRGEVSARLAAAMSLQPLSSEIFFLLEKSEDFSSIKWDLLEKILSEHQKVLIYGFTWMLWLAWGKQEFPESIKKALTGKSIHFVHSGGWKKLEAMKIDEKEFKSVLLKGLDRNSAVLDFYGLVEQVGIIYPLCQEGYRHVPVWADVLVRDPFTLETLQDIVGQLQLLNCLAFGAPYHSVLTEDLGYIVSSTTCKCGRVGKKFKLNGRIPKSELRGCANV